MLKLIAFCISSQVFQNENAASNVCSRYDLERPEEQGLPGELKKLKDLPRLLVVR